MFNLYQKKIRRKKNFYDNTISWIINKKSLGISAKEFAEATNINWKKKNEINISGI